MNDSFSLLAKSIRQNKINKEELLNNLKQISEAQSQREHYIKKVITLQKCFRGYLFRKNYGLLLEEININTVIDYLYEKKKKRIHEHKDEIISFFVLKYINKRKKKKAILVEQYKIHCANLIKARLKGIVIRKKIRKKLEIIRKAKSLILKHILSLRTILILKSSAIQNLLCDIAKIKYQLKNCRNDKIKELRNKLNKNINLFYDTYFYAKDNCNWGNESKENFFEEKWHKKYFDIINMTNKNDEKNKNGGNDQLYFLDNNDNIDNNFKIFSTSKRQRKQNFNSSKIIPKNLSESLKNKKYENSEFTIEFKIEEKENILNPNNKSKFRNSLNVANNFINSRKEKSKFFSDKNLKMQINDIDLNNINSQLFYSTKKINGFVPDEEIYPKSTNTYYQMEEREIKPLKTKDILNCKNPFGVREIQYKKSNTLKEVKENLFYQTDTLFFKRNSAKIIINRDEKPIGGNKINYNELFGEDGELKFEGDPFGGAKQFETKKDKDKINNISKSSKTNKKPVYDARKAIEEAKIKEGINTGTKNKEKHNKFREFLKEMKKINCNECDNKKDNKNQKDDELKIMKRYSENIKYEVEEKINGIKLLKPETMNDYFENTLGENKNNIEHPKKNAIKRESSLNKSSNQILRKKLHELEKTPAPALNKKGIRSKVNCWFNKESPKNNKNNKNKIENYIDKKLIELNIEINKINNSFNLNSYFEQKEEKMKKYRNVPFIKKSDNYVDYIKSINLDEYENILNDIDKEYKILK